MSIWHWPRCQYSWHAWYQMMMSWLLVDRMPSMKMSNHKEVKPLMKEVLRSPWSNVACTWWSRPYLLMTYGVIHLMMSTLEEWPHVMILDDVIHLMVVTWLEIIWGLEDYFGVLLMMLHYNISLHHYVMTWMIHSLLDTIMMTWMSYRILWWGRSQTMEKTYCPQHSSCCHKPFMDKI